ncbi:MAG TPA: beta-ketoacyl-ACP synthase III [Niabella sp.]|nr:beta-ketoacyl-ACP synthase III [Niabella sp.]HOZ98198.1 beta-ketoacyl-ACP synthase III [Niabella sp.]HQW16239.1 beta-ketoacyl-ACP synthase III [Niabella sp.]HQX21474.1 beta-ketoacyl-ACP synthase III [Niabella sp.]HQX42526.1 beta-ketoacyl-ACP synthase III [Niabella sp.]
MNKTIIAGVGKYIPEKVVTNLDLIQVMDTTDEWIQERTGIKERRHAKRFEETTATIGAKAAEMAIKNAGISKDDVDFIVFATLSPDYYFPGCGVLVQRLLNLKEIGALDIRNQCSGFIYGMSVADQFIKTGMYKNILVIGSEIHSYALDYSTRGRNVSVIFGDGAGAVLLQASPSSDRGILSTHLHSDGSNAEILSMPNPGFHAGAHNQKWKPQVDETNPYANLFINQALVDSEDHFPYMDGQSVFKKAVVKMPEVIHEALTKNGFQESDIDMLITHQANLRISQYMQQKLGLSDKQVFNNIQYYGNTTAASVPIALCEAWEHGRIKEGDLVCLAAFGSGFTWGSVLMKW